MPFFDDDDLNARVQMQLDNIEAVRQALHPDTAPCASKPDAPGNVVSLALEREKRKARDMPGLCS